MEVFGDCKSISKIEIPKKQKRDLMVHGEEAQICHMGHLVVVVI